MFSSLTVLCAGSAAAAETITSIGQVRSLTPEQAAKGLSARVRGIVTRCNEYEVYLQEGTEAIFVSPSGKRAPYQPGDYVELTGVTSAGQFLPVLIEQGSQVLGHRPLPEPVPASYEDLRLGRLDCRYVEVTGLVRAARLISPGKIECRLALNGAIVRVEIATSYDHPTNLVGSKVQLRGVAGGVKNGQRQLIEVVLWVLHNPESLQILAAPPEDLFGLPTEPIVALMSLAQTAKSIPLTKISGQITWAASDTQAYLRDNTGTVEVRLQSPTHMQDGDFVEVVGFADNGLIKPHLADAIARVTGRGEPPAPVKTTVERLLASGSEASLVEIEGTVQGAFRSASAITLLLDERAVSFRATYETNDAGANLHIPPIGARIAVIGICRVDEATSIGALISPSSFQLRLRSMDDIRTISAPSFWTTRRLFVLVSGLSATLLLAAIWIWSLRKTVAQQTRVIVSRTRSEATMEERDRIARELHDSLEQHLTGATMLLDATASVWAPQPDAARAHLETARAMLRHSLDEAQRAVFNLRSRELEGGDLWAALERSLRLMLASTNVKLVMETTGNHPEFDGVSENHLLRVAQEAVANALKHADPKQVRVSLVVDDRHLKLTVEDDGCGFVVESAAVSAAAGKFGQIGMRERAEKLRGHVSFHSTPGHGSRVEFVMPLNERDLARAK